MTVLVESPNKNVVIDENQDNWVSIDTSTISSKSSDCVIDEMGDENKKNGTDNSKEVQDGNGSKKDPNSSSSRSGDVETVDSVSANANGKNKKKQQKFSKICCEFYFRLKFFFFQTHSCHLE